MVAKEIAFANLAIKLFESYEKYFSHRDEDSLDQVDLFHIQFLQVICTYKGHDWLKLSNEEGYICNRCSVTTNEIEYDNNEFPCLDPELFK